MIEILLCASAGFMLGSMIGVAFGKSAERARSDESLAELADDHSEEVRALKESLHAARVVSGEVIQAHRLEIADLRTKLRAYEAANSAPAAWEPESAPSPTTT